MVVFLARPATIPRARAAETGQKRIPIIWTGKLNPSRIPGDASFGKATFK
jgi:hypothetical protein